MLSDEEREQLRTQPLAVSLTAKEWGHVVGALERAAQVTPGQRGSDAAQLAEKVEEQVRMAIENFADA